MFEKLGKFFEGIWNTVGKVTESLWNNPVTKFAWWGARLTVGIPLGLTIVSAGSLAWAGAKLFELTASEIVEKRRGDRLYVDEFARSIRQTVQNIFITLPTKNLIIGPFSDVKDFLVTNLSAASSKVGSGHSPDESDKSPLNIVGPSETTRIAGLIKSGKNDEAKEAYNKLLDNMTKPRPGTSPSSKEVQQLAAPSQSKTPTL